MGSIKSLKSINKFKVFNTYANSQGQGHRIKNISKGTYGNIVNRNTLIENKSCSTNCSKIIKKVKVSDRITEFQTRQKQYDTDLRSRGH